MVKKIAYTLYPVIDMSRARKFYQDELGLVATAEYADGQWVEYEPGSCFVLTTLAPVTPSRNSGGNIAFEVDDVVALTAQLRKNGVEIQMDVTDTPSHLMSVVVDPEGNGVTLCQLK
jgi:predicted enzyme related to lactoylglutathione lyase